MKLYLVRHGETYANKHKFVQGAFDLDMTDKGYEQAEKVGERFKFKKFDKIYASDLRRAKNTAHEIAKHQNQKIHEDILLRERHHGREEGSNYNRVMWEGYKKSVDFKFEDGESIYDHYIRTQKFIDKLLEDHNEGEEILIVSHGGTIKSIWINLLKLSKEEVQEMRDKNEALETHNTCVYIIDLSDRDNPKIELANCTKHLE